MLLEAIKTPDTSYALTNTVAVSPNDFSDASKDRCVVVGVRPVTQGNSSYSTEYLYSVVSNPKIPSGKIGFAGHQRKWSQLAIGQHVEVQVRQITNIATLMTVELEFMKTADATKYQDASFNSDNMATEFSQQFNSQAFSNLQAFIFAFEGVNFTATVKSIQSLDTSKTQAKLTDMKTSTVQYALTSGNTQIHFQASQNSPLMLSGRSQNLKSKQNNIINPEFDFAQMGIGGLGDEFKEIFRRAFASRIFPPDIVAKMGGKHVKGILLHGPPGCGKTLMARKIGKMLSAREPQVVNGPEILNKFVGESEKNIRALFEPAEEEQKRLGKRSGLHIIIFDEIDAICKQRGSSASGGSQVGDTVVNQLLSKIDGVNQLDNILVIGMTNRPDLIDDALLRPGRLEVKKEIRLPDEGGRVEILNIHTEKMRANNMLASDVDLKELASKSKNFSGAELEGLVRAAQSYAITRHTKGEGSGTKVEVNWETVDEMQVNLADFNCALEKDIKAAFGTQDDQFDQYITNGILEWGTPLKDMMNEAKLVINQVTNSKRTPFVTCLLEGTVGSGKTALAAKLAQLADFPFVKFISPKDMVGFNEQLKSQKIAKIFEDAHKSNLSCIIIDDVERLIEYNPIGPRFSNLIAQTLLILLKKPPPAGRKLLVIATSSSRNVMQQMGLTDGFGSIIRVPTITNCGELKNALELMNSFDKASRDSIFRQLESCSSVFVPIKKLIHIVGAIEQLPQSEIAAQFLCKMEETCNLK